MSKFTELIHRIMQCVCSTQHETELVNFGLNKEEIPAGSIRRLHIRH